jgi:hypothetical protein
MVNIGGEVSEALRQFSYVSLFIYVTVGGHGVYARVSSF